MLTAALLPQLMQANAGTIEAGGQEVIDRQFDPRRVELLEDGTDTADRLMVRILDARLCFTLVKRTPIPARRWFGGI